MADNLFHNSKDEINLCNALKAFVGEWGRESVWIELPKAWESLQSDGKWAVETRFTTDRDIVIKVNHHGQTCSYQLTLKDVNSG